MHTNNRLFDDLARVMTGAAGAAQGVREEVETAFRLRLERMVADLDLVPREEFEVVRQMAAAARTENEALKAKIAEIEARLEAGSATAKKPASKSGGK